MAELIRTDLCVVGAGALGVALAQHARALGARVMLVDRGFAEPNDGADAALRLAALQASAARAQAQRDGTLGIAAAEPKISFKAIQERVRSLLAERAPVTSDERFKALGVDLVRGETRFIDGQTLGVGDTQVRAGTFILAAGAEPIVPPIAGLDDIKAFSTESVLESTRKLSHLLVIGGDPSAYVLGQVFARLGSEVTIVPQGPTLPGFDTETARILLDMLAAENVAVLDGGRVGSIQARSQGIGATVEPTTGPKALDVSHVLVAMGYSADLGALRPEAARLRSKDGNFALGELGQTSNRRVRVVGPAAGISQWHHVVQHGKAVVEAALTGAPRQKLAPQPLVVATEPALVQIGRPAGAVDKIKPGSGIYRASLAENDAALAQNRAEGLVKVMTDPNGMITGASLVGAGASEMASLLALAMQRGLGLDALASVSLPHPSLFEVISHLGENHMASRVVSPWTARRRAVRRFIPL